jgi:hypothetical protein
VYSLTRGRCLGLAFGSINILIGALRAGPAILATGLGAESSRSLATATLLLVVFAAGVSFPLAPSRDAFSVAAEVTSEAPHGARSLGAVDDFTSFDGWGLEELPSISLRTPSVSLSLGTAALLMTPLDWDFFRTVEAFEDLGRDVTAVVAVSRKQSAVSTGSQNFDGSSHGNI